MLAAASAAQAAVAFVSIGLPAIGPELSHEFGLSLAELGAVLTAVLLGSGLSLIAAGIVVDRFGARIPTLAGTALAATGLAVAATAGTAPVLFVALAVSGFGSAVVPVAGAGALFRVYEPGRRAWALGVRQMSVPLGGMLAALAMPRSSRRGELTLTVAAVAVAVTRVLSRSPPTLLRLGVRARRPFRSIWRAPACSNCSSSPRSTSSSSGRASFTVPALTAGPNHSPLAPFLRSTSAMVPRVAWGHVADGGNTWHAHAGGGRGCGRARRLLFTIAHHTRLPP